MIKVTEIFNFYYNKALLDVNEKRISSAVKNLEEAFKYYTKDIEALNLMGLCLYKLCEFDKASFYWKMSVEIDSIQNKATDYLESLNSIEFENLFSEYNNGILSIQNREYREAIRIFKDIIEENHELIEPYVIISLCYYQVNEYKLSKEYIGHAIDMDKENLKYLIYFDEINKLNTKIIITKAKKKKDFYMSILVVLIFSSIVSIYYFSDKYRMVANNLLSKEGTIELVSKQLVEKEKEVNDLKEDLIEEKLKTDDILNVDEAKSFVGSDFEIFEDAIREFRKEAYENAIEKLNFIVKNSVEEDLVAESIYFLAVSFEKKQNYTMAENFYTKYIQGYNNKNYYDDSLYNYGLMLYKLQKKELSKEILTKLLEEVPMSIFNNSKVEYILKG